MNKTELTEKLAKMTGLPKVKAGEVVDALFDARPGKGIIAIELDKGRKVAIPGFGTFSSRLRIFRKDDRAGRPAFLIFEVGRRGWLAFDRFDYAIAREDWRRLAMLLRRAAGEGEEK